MPRGKLARISASLVALFVLSGVAPHAGAQAMPVAERKVDLSAFVGFDYTDPDYDRYYHDTGVSFGVNITRYFRFPVAPSLEARANLVSGHTVNEKTYLFGVRGQYEYRRRYHPYADFLVGPGTIHFDFAPAGGYVGDNSVVYSYGGGIDIDVWHSLGVKADVQGQHWKTGQEVTLTPFLITVGATYHLPVLRGR